MLKHYTIKKITPIYSITICSAETTLNEILFHFYYHHLRECEVGDMLYLIEDDKVIQGTLLVTPYKESMFLAKFCPHFRVYKDCGEDGSIIDTFFCEYCGEEISINVHRYKWDNNKGELIT